MIMCIYDLMLRLLWPFVSFNNNKGKSHLFKIPQNQYDQFAWNFYSVGFFFLLFSFQMKAMKNQGAAPWRNWKKIENRLVGSTGYDKGQHAWIQVFTSGRSTSISATKINDVFCFF